MPIHPSAFIEDGAVVDKDAEIGAFCFVGKNATLGKVTLLPHTVIEGRTTMADGVIISSFACIGGLPQIDGFDSSDAGQLHIGKNTIIREYATINCGSDKDKATVIGAGCLLMIGSHVGHDCRIGEHVILANDVALAGHVEIGDFAVIGGLSGIHQQVRIGHHAMVGFLSAVDKDVIPYGLVKQEQRAHLQHLNWRRMKGSKFSRTDMLAAKKLFDELFNNGGELRENAKRLLHENKGSIFAEDILQFILSDSKRKITTPSPPSPPSPTSPPSKE